MDRILTLIFTLTLLTSVILTVFAAVLALRRHGGVREAWTRFREDASGGEIVLLSLVLPKTAELGALLLLLVLPLNFSYQFAGIPARLTLILIMTFSEIVTNLILALYFANGRAQKRLRMLLNLWNHSFHFF